MFQKLWPFNSSSLQTGAPPAYEPQDHGVSTKVKPIHASFNKGISLNMKIVIRGDIRTGKTSVFERLQGHPFPTAHEYNTTQQIQVANIPWQYPHSKDIIKVEIWDVVDKAIHSTEAKTSSSSSNSTALKIDNNTPMSPTSSKSLPNADHAPHAAFSLDASTIDVYRNTDGVILTYDISKPWTLDYAAKALDDIPQNMPVLVLSNFSDDGHPRPMAADERIETLIMEHNAVRRNNLCAPANLIRRLETSMKTGLGLKEIHESLGIPFLNVLRETHRKQFEQKTQEIQDLLRTLDNREQERPRQSTQHSKRSSYQQHAQSSQPASQPLSPKEVTASSRRVLPVPTSIQTTGPGIRPIAETSSPTSPSRKTRNEHTNVEILSPTPVSAQTPAVLFDFNAGKLEEDFFQNVEHDAPASAPATLVSSHASALSPTAATGLGLSSGNQVLSGSFVTALATEEEDEFNGNPMVAADEDIGPDSQDNLVEVVPAALREPIWTHNRMEQDLMSRHLVEDVKQTHMEEIQDDDEHNDKLAADEDSESSSMDGFPPIRQTVLQEDSDLESQPDYPVASAMYYEYNPSSSLSPSKIMHGSVLARYEEIAEGGQHEKNPWDSTGDLLSGGGGGGTKTNHFKEDGEYTEDRVGDSLSSMVIQSTGPEDLNSRKNDIEISTDLISSGSVGELQPSSAATASTESSGVDPEDEMDDDETESSPTASLAAAGEKKKSKKKSKKKGK
ncbi:Rab-like protein 6 [Dissophora globulifera]|uniref:Rab-like protein 6 n=1 Tax=Dissophora globulifera TaxID=979702 RepID=A0A9P6R4U0_9FUNG|nr:Rab-like protein 6 [Dissophora globulifera]